MPYTGKPKGYDQYIGHGTEKKVYGSTEDETKVVKESHSRSKNERDINFIKGQYYLTKILHLLLPKNIPDIHYTTIEDGKHITIDQRVKQSEGETKKDKDPVEFMRDRSEVVKKFYDLGVFFDDSFVNFDYNDQGDVIYYDSFVPWRKSVRDDERVLEIKEEALKKAISEIPDERQKEEAGNYLERLMILYNQEIEDRKKSADE